MGVAPRDLGIIEYFGYYWVLWVLLSILGILAYFCGIGSSNFWFYAQSKGRVTLQEVSQ